MSSSKKKSEDTDITRETETDSFTQSFTGTDISEGDQSIENLLGSKTLPLVKKERALLRLHNYEVLSSIYERLGRKAEWTPLKIKAPIVIGPFEEADLEKLLQARLISRFESIYFCKDRWKSIMDVYSQYRIEDFRVDENTETNTFTETSAFKYNSETNTQEHVSEKTPIKLVLSEEERVQKETPVEEEALEPLKPLPALQKADPQQKGRFSLGVEKKERKQEISRTPRHSNADTDSRKPKERSNFWVYAFVAFAALMFGLSQYKSKQSVFENSSLEDQLNSKNISKWPQELRPRTLNIIRTHKDALVNKLLPVLRDYERGNYLPSPEDERMLRSLASPASASLEARILASNQLAAFKLAKGRSSEALNSLKPVFRANPSHIVTLINMSLSFLVERNFSQAEELAGSALRLCRFQNCWLPYALMGLIKGLSGKTLEADSHFESALSASTQNPVVYGLWLRVSGRNKKKTQKIFERSLLSDPDKEKDAPISAPIARHIFLLESTRGYRDTLNSLKKSKSVTEGQKLFKQWQLGRLGSNPLSINLVDVRSSLEAENNPLSQLYLAYLYKEEERMDEAAQVLNQNLSRLGKKNVLSSWPWSLAADVQFKRGLLDQSALYYQAALSRNSRDLNAVYGLALILREKGDYSGAKQKIDEVLNVEPDYKPAQLRIHRFDWQKQFSSL